MNRQEFLALKRYEQNRLASEAFGIPPWSTSWWVWDPKANAICYTDEWQGGAIDWMAEHPEYCKGYEVREHPNYRDFVRRIEEAWQLVEKLLEEPEKWLVRVQMMPKDHPWILEGSRSEYDAPCPDREVCKGMHSVTLTPMNYELRAERIQNGLLNILHDIDVMHDSVPMAIVIAALMAKGIIK